LPKTPEYPANANERDKYVMDQWAQGKTGPEMFPDLPGKQGIYIIQNTRAKLGPDALPFRRKRWSGGPSKGRHADHILEGHTFDDDPNALRASTGRTIFDFDDRYFNRD